MNTTWLSPCLRLWRAVTSTLDSSRPLAALAARVYIAQVFLLAGLTQIRDWDITLLLFTEEYKVPVLSPEVAAVMGTAGELVLPVLLLLGLAGRFAALAIYGVGKWSIDCVWLKPRMDRWTNVVKATLNKA